jgi:prepilin-type N-terminal cleavage/methylation domain-containing protein
MAIDKIAHKNIRRSSGEASLHLLRAGFTLIELLVVISIIALLLSILLPSLNRAKEAAKNVVCKTQMHNMGLAAFMYGDDYNGYLVVATSEANPVGTFVSSFEVLLDPYLNELAPIVASAGFPNVTDSSGGGLWKCPGDNYPRSDLYLPQFHPPRSYVINGWLTLGQFYFVGPDSVKLDNMPPGIIIFGEAWADWNKIRSELGAANWFYSTNSMLDQPPLYGKFHYKRLANFLVQDMSVQGYDMEFVYNSPRIAGDRYYF